MNPFEAFVRPDYFGRDFRDPSWDTWKVVLKACCGLELTADERLLFHSITQREPLPEGYNECYLVAGRRSGKTRVAAALLCAHALIGGHGDNLAPGERAYGFLFSVDKVQSSVAYGYCKAFLERFPDLIERVTNEQIDLKNNTSIMVKTSSYKSSRGFTTFGIVLDELSFFSTDEYASPASELIEALQYSLLEKGIIWGCSSPYAKMGYLWEQYREHFGQDSPVLVVQAGTRVLNPSYSETLMARLRNRKKKSAVVELDAQFRDDITSFIDEDTLSRYTTLPAYSERKPGYTYIAFLDPSGGSNDKGDSMTLSIAHAEEGYVHIDRVEEFIPPFSPEDVARVFTEIIKQYGCLLTYSDRWGGEWVRSRFKDSGIVVEISPLSASELYNEFNFMLRAGDVRLPNHEKMLRQFVCLERQARVGGKDAITHQPGGHDDIVNAISGACVMVRQRYRKLTPKEIEAMMPVKGPHKTPKDFLVRQEMDKADQRRDNAAIMDEFMRGSGCSPASLPTRPRKPWDNWR